MAQEVIVVIVWLLAGHFCGCTGFYLNHRYVMHGKLGKFKFFKKIKRLHAIHHAHPYDALRNKHLIIPVWGKILMAIMIAFLSYLNFAFAIGVLSFFLVYGYRHYRIHNQDRSSYFYQHHHYHHVYDSTTNFSGVYPIIDRLFRTYTQTKFNKIKRLK